MLLLLSGLLLAVLGFLGVCAPLAVCVVAFIAAVVWLAWRRHGAAAGPVGTRMSDGARRLDHKVGPPSGEQKPK